MEEKLYFQNSRGNRLCGILCDPTGNKNRFVIILCHGFNSGKDSSTNTALKTNLDKNNVASFRFDFFAHGESEGNFEDLTVSEAVDDILQAIKLLKNLGFLKIGLEGSSFGGLAAAMTASKTTGLYLLALKCPVSSYLEFRKYANPMLIKEWKKLGYNYRENKKIKYSFYEDVIKNVAYDVGEKISVPTIIVHGDKDIEVPIEQSIKLSKLIPNCELKPIKGAGHLFREGNSRELMIGVLTDFIVKHSK
jgi:hypothetical protein